MSHYRFLNIEVTNEYISADIFDGQNYIMRIIDHIIHVKYTNINNAIYQEFQNVAKAHLGSYDGEPEDQTTDASTNIIKWDFRKNPV